MKYRGDDTAIDRLIAKVKAGGKGAWGDVPMPPYSPRVPDADIKVPKDRVTFSVDQNDTYLRRLVGDWPRVSLHDGTAMTIRGLAHLR